MDQRVTPHPLATKAGAKVLRAGGNAIEEAIAIGATIGVVYPHFCGLGGDAVWLVANREGRRAAFLGIGQAAQALPTFDCRIPTRGPLSILTTACAADSWRHAMEWSSEGHFDLAAHGAGSADHIHLCVEAVKRSFLTRDAIADPDFGPPAGQGMAEP